MKIDWKVIAQSKGYKSLKAAMIKDIQSDFEFTSKHWVNQNLPIKKGKVNHPDTYRIL